MDLKILFAVAAFLLSPILPSEISAIENKDTPTEEPSIVEQDLDSKAKSIVASLVPKKSWISDFEARLALARVLSYQKHRQREALKQYKILLTKQPLNPILLYETGRIYLVLKKFSAALASISLALEQDPDHPEYLLAAAQAEAGLGHARKCNQLMQRLLSLYKGLYKPGAIPLKTLISYADMMMLWGDFYKAEQIYLDALKIHPQSLEYSLKLGGVLTSTQQYEKAENLYRQLLLQHPSNPNIYTALIQVKNLAKDFIAALEMLEELLAFRPKPRYRLLQADILYQAGYYEQSLKAYAELLGSSKKTSLKATAYVGIGKNYLKLNEQEEAETAFYTALQLNSKNIPAKYYLADIKGEDIQAYTTDRLAIKTLAQWAELSIENGISEPAKYLYTRILARDPEYFPAQIGLPEMLSVNFEYQAALSFYFSLLEIFPDNSKIIMAIARVYSWSRKYQTSLSWYNELIELNPNDTLTWLEEARVYANRRRTHSRAAQGEKLQRLRSERTERTFAHVCETGGARRSWLTGIENVRKRYLISAAAHSSASSCARCSRWARPRPATVPDGPGGASHGRAGSGSTAAPTPRRTRSSSGSCSRPEGGPRSGAARRGCPRTGCLRASGRSFRPLQADFRQAAVRGLYDRRANSVNPKVAAVRSP